MHWPRGKYNGRRVTGFEFKIIIDLDQWEWIPVTTWKWSGGIHWLCIRTFTNWTYEQ